MVKDPSGQKKSYRTEFSKVFGWVGKSQELSFI